MVVENNERLCIRVICFSSSPFASSIKVHRFWEGHKILRNLYLIFVLCSASQKQGRDFAKFCGLLRIYELYWKKNQLQKCFGPDCLTWAAGCSLRTIKEKKSVIFHLMKNMGALFLTSLMKKSFLRIKKCELMVKNFIELSLK